MCLNPCMGFHRKDRSIDYLPLWSSVIVSHVRVWVVLCFQEWTCRETRETTEEWEDKAKSEKASFLQVWWTWFTGICLLEEDNSLPEETTGTDIFSVLCFNSADQLSCQLTSPIHSEVWVHAFCANFPHHPLRECFRCSEGWSITTQL